MKKNAFSLIELSIVILIIGILIAGITQSSRLVAAMKLNTARSLTQSSPVSSIKGITVWLDSTSEKAFGSGIDLNNNDPVSNWYSINPQSISNFITTQSGSANQPKYVTNGINGLPVVDFDGGDCLQRANTKGDEVFSSREVSIFLVQKYGGAAAGSNSNVGFFVDASDVLFRFTMHLPNSNGNIYSDLFTGACCGSRVFATTPSSFYRVSHIVSVVRQQDTSGGSNDVMTLRMDGGQLASTTSNTLPMPVGYTDNFSVGCWYAGAAGSYLGQIGELIIFDRYLRDEDRKLVEKYLGQKWGIKVS